MGLAFADRVRESTTTTGTGDVTLVGSAPTGFRTFASVASVGDNVYYTIVGGTEWEVGYGTLTGATTLSRARVISSSNSNALVSFSAGTKDVFMTVPATLIQGRGTVWATTNGYTLF